MNRLGADFCDDVADPLLYGSADKDETVEEIDTEGIEPATQFVEDPFASLSSLADMMNVPLEDSLSSSSTSSSGADERLEMDAQSLNPFIQVPSAPPHPMTLPPRLKWREQQEMRNNYPSGVAPMEAGALLGRTDYGIDVWKPDSPFAQQEAQEEAHTLYEKVQALRGELAMKRKSDRHLTVQRAQLVSNIQDFDQTGMDIQKTMEMQQEALEKMTRMIIHMESHSEATRKRLEENRDTRSTFARKLAHHDAFTAMSRESTTRLAMELANKEQRLKSLVPILQQHMQNEMRQQDQRLQDIQMRQQQLDQEGREMMMKEGREKPSSPPTSRGALLAEVLEFFANCLAESNTEAEAAKMEKEGEGETNLDSTFLFGVLPSSSSTSTPSTAMPSFTYTSITAQSFKTNGDERNDERSGQTEDESETRSTAQMDPSKADTSNYHTRDAKIDYPDPSGQEGSSQTMESVEENVMQGKTKSNSGDISSPKVSNTSTTPSSTYTSPIDTTSTETIAPESPVKSSIFESFPPPLPPRNPEQLRQAAMANWQPSFVVSPENEGVTYPFRRHSISNTKPSSGSAVPINWRD